MGTLTIRIDEALENSLEQLAKSQRRTKSDLAREMLRKRVAVERLRELRRKALRHIGKLPVLSPRQFWELLAAKIQATAEITSVCTEGSSSAASFAIFNRIFALAT
jgi:predicted DNA-binding protein